MLTIAGLQSRISLSQGVFRGPPQGRADLSPCGEERDWHARIADRRRQRNSAIVYTTDLGEEGIDLGKIYDYDIILLDLNLPDMSGFEVLRSLRVSKVKTPILILTGLAGIEDKVRGLGFGADDYMTKPFHKDELVARIHAIVRRSKGHAQSVIQTGDLVVNLDTKTVEVNAARVVCGNVQTANATVYIISSVLTP